MLLLSFNIQYGFGRDGHYDLARAASEIAKADIAAIQEVDRHWSRTGHDDQPARLAALLPDHFIAYAPAFDMAAPTPQDRNRRRQFGPLIASRWPILWTRTHLLPLWPMLNPLNTQTCALEACIAAPQGPLRVFSIHLAHVGVAERLAQIDHLLSLSPAAPWSGTDDEPDRNWTEGEAPPPCPSNAIWMGDFNMEPGSAEYHRLVDQSPYHPGALYAQGLVDAVALTGTSLHSHEKSIAGVKRLRQLDHAFVTSELVSRIARAWSDTANPASDHFPLWVELA